MKKQAKFSLKGFHKPTPANIKKIGNALFATGCFALTMTFVTENDTICQIFGGIAILGKGITAFFSEEPENGSPL